MPEGFLFEDDGLSLLHWLVEADGEAHALDGSEGVTLVDLRGAALPPTQIVSEPVPFQAGETTRRVNVRPRSMELLLDLRGSTFSQMRDRHDDLMRWLDPTRGEARFRRRRENGVIREVWCRRSDGAFGNESYSLGAMQGVALTLEATDDPYAYDLDDTTASYSTGSPANPFFTNPFFPLNLSASTVIAAPTITNDGQAEAWPVWTITGPGTDPVVRNLTTGLLFSFAYTLTAGQQLIVDTRPPARRDTTIPHIRLASGDNLFGSLSGGSGSGSGAASDLFPLVVGANHLQLEMGGVSAASSIALSFRKRWLGL